MSSKVDFTSDAVPAAQADVSLAAPESVVAQEQLQSFVQQQEDNYRKAAQLAGRVRILERDIADAKGARKELELLEKSLSETQQGIDDLTAAIEKQQETIAKLEGQIESLHASQEDAVLQAQEEIAKLSEQLAQAKKEIRPLEKQLAPLQSQHQSLDAACDLLYREIVKLELQLEKEEEPLKRAEKEKAALQKEIQNLEESIQAFPDEEQQRAEQAQIKFEAELAKVRASIQALEEEHAGLKENIVIQERFIKKNTASILRHEEGYEELSKRLHSDASQYFGALIPDHDGLIARLQSLSLQPKSTLADIAAYEKANAKFEAENAALEEENEALEAQLAQIQGVFSAFIQLQQKASSDSPAATVDALHDALTEAEEIARKMLIEEASSQEDAPAEEIEDAPEDDSQAADIEEQFQKKLEDDVATPTEPTVDSAAQSEPEDDEPVSPQDTLFIDGKKIKIVEDFSAGKDDLVLLKELREKYSGDDEPSEKDQQALAELAGKFADGLFAEINASDDGFEIDATVFDAAFFFAESGTAVTFKCGDVSFEFSAFSE